MDERAAYGDEKSWRFLLCCFFILLVSFVRYETCLLVVFNFSDCLLLTIYDGWLAKAVHRGLSPPW